MTQITIPFKERFREPMLNGTKTWTSRTKAYGQIGDWFNAFGQTFVLTYVGKYMFQTIVNLHWKDEGCNSKEDFLAVWREIHPKRELKDCELFWVHIFQNVSIKEDLKK